MARAVITALTAQNTQGVAAIHDVPADFIAAQIDAVFSDLAVGAVKIGMLSHAAAIEAVATGLARHRAKNIVLDPVMVATSGDRLLAPRRDRRAAPRADPARADGDAQSAGGRRAHRREPCAQRAGNGSAGARDPGARRAQRADQRRPRRRRRERRSAGRAGRGRAPVGRAHRHQEHARHRLHAVVGDRGGARQGPRPRRRACARRQEPTSPRPSPPPTNSHVGHGHGPLHHFYRAMEQSHDHATSIHHRGGRERRRRCWPRRPSRARRR